MLIGAHVSIAGGLAKAIERGVDLECDAIQIFSQSSRAWRPNRYTDDDVAKFREAMAASRIEAVLIHAVYLINCASLEPEIREKSLTALKNSLQLGDRIGAAGVVLHPGSQKGRDYEECMTAVGDGLREALAESENCPLLLEDTAGHQGTLGRDFAELARLIDLGGGDERLGLCLDSAHLFASGFDIATRDGLTAVVDQLDAEVGLSRLRALHVNDSKMPFGSNRDRHANLGQGEIGERGLRVFLSEPRFQDLPAVLETPITTEDAYRAEVRQARRLRREGQANRRRAKRR